jgi:hypothetical protein
MNTATATQKSNVKTLVTQAIDEQGNAKLFTTPFRTTIERVKEGDIVAYLAKGEDGGPVVEHLLDVVEVATHGRSVTLLFADGNFREALEGLPLTVARRK